MPDTLSSEQTAARVDKVVSGMEEAMAAGGQEAPAIPVLPEADQAPDPAAPAEITPQDEAGLDAMNSSTDGVEPVHVGPVSDPNILDLRTRQREQDEANAQARVQKLQAMADAGEHTVTPEALDRQAARDAGTNTENSATTPAVDSTKAAGEEKSWFKKLLRLN